MVPTKNFCEKVDSISSVEKDIIFEMFYHHQNPGSLYQAKRVPPGELPPEQ